MSDFFKAVGIVLAGLAAIFALSYLALANARFFAPRHEALRNEVFHNSQAYTDGMAHDLDDIQTEYVQATPEAKVSLRAIAIRRFSIYPQDRLTPEQRAFYNDLKAAQ